MNNVSQQHSKAGGDIVGGDKVTTYNAAPKSKIEKLLTKLQEQSILSVVSTYGTDLSDADKNEDYKDPALAVAA